MAPRGESPPECGVAQVYSASPTANPVGVKTSEVQSCRQPICPVRAVARFEARSRARRAGAAACAACAAAAAAIAVLGASLALAGGRSPRRRPDRRRRSVDVGAAGVVALSARSASPPTAATAPRRAAPCALPARPRADVDGIAGPQTLARARAARARPPARRAERHLLERIAQCESGGDPTRRVGGRPLPRQVPVLARDVARAGRQGRSRQGARGRQDRLAAKLLALSGTSPWPNCWPQDACGARRLTGHSSAAPPAPRACAARVPARRRRPSWRGGPS